MLAIELSQVRYVNPELAGFGGRALFTLVDVEVEVCFRGCSALANCQEVRPSVVEVRE